LGTPTKRQVSKRQVSKRPVSKRPKRQVYKTSGLQNIRFTKRQVFKTSGCNTSGFKTSLLVNISKRQVSKMYNITSILRRKTGRKGYEDILEGLGGHYLVKEQQNYEEILVKS
jgi:hypothetical protein